MRAYKNFGDYLLAKSCADPMTGCRVWIGQLTKDGYGHVDMRAMRRAHIKTAHRASWIEANGAIEIGNEIDHICRNRACINTEHLRSVTRAVNMAGRRHNPLTHVVFRGKDSHSAKLSEFQVEAIRIKRMKGRKLREIAAEYNVCQATISLIANRKTWAHI